MDEKESKREEETTEDTGKGVQSETTTLFEQTNQATERLERANTKTEELLNRQEEIYQRQKLGGNSEAGIPAPKNKTQDELDDEEAEQRVKAFQ